MSLSLMQLIESLKDMTPLYLMFLCTVQPVASKFQMTNYPVVCEVLQRIVHRAVSSIF